MAKHKIQQKAVTIEIITKKQIEIIINTKGAMAVSSGNKSKFIVKLDT